MSPEILDRALADHEAGHLIVAVALDRGVKQVSLENIDGIRGCFFLPANEEMWDDFYEMLFLIAGTRAQVELCPESLTAEQQVMFGESINQPQQSPRLIPAVYDGTYWGPDMKVLYNFLRMPFAPATGLAFGTRRRDVVDRAEIRLKQFFFDPDRRGRCREVANVLKAERAVQGPAARALVGQYFNLSEARALLTLS